MGVDQSPQPYIGAVPPGAYWIRNSYSGNALDLEGSNAAPGTPIVNYQVHRGLNQKWILEPGIRGYKIKNAKTGTFMGFASHDGISKGSSISGNPAAIEWDIVSEGSNYKIRLSADTSLILDLANYGIENGNKVIVWPDNCGANQHWILESCNPATYVGIIGPGAYWIRNGHTKAALDLAVPSCAPATPVINGEITRRPSQKWILETGTHGFRFKNAETGTYLSIAYRLAPVKYMNVTCNPLPMEWDVVKNGWNYSIRVPDNYDLALELAGGSYYDRNPMFLNHYHGDRTQEWILEDASNPPLYTSASIITPGGYWIRNALSKMALDLAGANPAPGTPVVNYHVHRGQNQKWMLESGNKGYRIKNAQTGTYLGLAANVIEKQGNSVSCNPTPAEWDVVADGSNFIIKLASNKNMVLDLAYGVGKDGNKIIIWPMHGGANQQWIIEPE